MTPVYLTGENGKGVTPGAIARANHPLLDPAHGGNPPWVGIKTMAQAIITQADPEYRRRCRAPEMGHLLGTRRFTGHSAAFPIEAPLQIEVQRLYLKGSGLGTYDCRIYGAAREWARATIAVLQTDHTFRP